MIAITNSPPVLGGVAAASADGVVRWCQVDYTTRTPMRYYKNNPDFRGFRTQLRKNLTPAEAALWNILKNKKLDGRKFRRQYGIDKYVLDFYCPAERLGIELDGEGHFSIIDVLYDNKRRRFVSHFGIRIIRFANDWVFKEPEVVIETIRSNFSWWEKSTTPPSQSLGHPS